MEDQAGTICWNNVEIQFGTTSRPNFNYISTLFQRQMPAEEPWRAVPMVSTVPTPSNSITHLAHVSNDAIISK